MYVWDCINSYVVSDYNKHLMHWNKLEYDNRCDHHGNWSCKLLVRDSFVDEDYNSCMCSVVCVYFFE